MLAKVNVLVHEVERDLGPSSFCLVVFIGFQDCSILAWNMWGGVLRLGQKHA